MHGVLVQKGSVFRPLVCVFVHTANRPGDQRPQGQGNASGEKGDNVLLRFAWCPRKGGCFNVFSRYLPQARERFPHPCKMYSVAWFRGLIVGVVLLVDCWLVALQWQLRFLLHLPRTVNTSRLHKHFRHLFPPRGNTFLCVITCFLLPPGTGL